GSETTGPGPLGGGMKSSSRSCQPVRSSGAKLGFFTVSAPAAGARAAATQIALASKYLANAPSFGTPPTPSLDMSDLRVCCDRIGCDHSTMIICYDHCNTSDRRNTRHLRSKEKLPQQPPGHSKTAQLLASRLVISEQIKSASLGSLIGGGGGGGSGIGARRCVRIAHQGSVRQFYRHELSAVVAVAKRMNSGLDFHAGRKGLG